MPNLEPSEWTARAMPGPNGGSSCANTTCVAADRRDDGVHVTSTIVGNDGLVVFTQDEWNVFIADAKAGRWDHTVTAVPVTA